MLHWTSIKLSTYIFHTYTCFEKGIPQGFSAYQRVLDLFYIFSTVENSENDKKKKKKFILTSHQISLFNLKMFPLLALRIQFVSLGKPLNVLCRTMKQWGSLSEKVPVRIFFRKIRTFNYLKIFILEMAANRGTVLDRVPSRTFGER